MHTHNFRKKAIKQCVYPSIVPSNLKCFKMLKIFNQIIIYVLTIARKESYQPMCGPLAPIYSFPEF